MDYSQTGEQDAILKILGYGEPPVKMAIDPQPRFIDIGAWNPTTFSNTRALYELGWGGLMIEPSPGPVRELVWEYGRSERVTVIAAAATIADSLVVLQVTDDAVSAEVGSDNAKRWAVSGGFYGKLIVPGLTLDNLFKQFGGDFRMVSIDTEGTSVELFVELLRIGVRPQCIVVEHDNRIVELAQHGQNAGYQQVFLTANNAVFQWMSGV